MQNSKYYENANKALKKIKFLEDSLDIIISKGISDYITINIIRRFIGILKKETILFKRRIVFGFYDEDRFLKRFEKIYSGTFDIINLECMIIGCENIYSLNEYCFAQYNNVNNSNYNGEQLVTSKCSDEYSFTSDSYEEEQEEYLTKYFNIKY